MPKLNKIPTYQQGWFIIPGVKSNGYRTLTEQLTNLDMALAAADGKSVLDLGCAEGLIAKTFACKGARRVDALTIVQGEIDIGRTLCDGLPVNFHQVDLRDFDRWANKNPLTLLPQYDMLLLLSIIHKMRDIGRFIEQVLPLAADWLVVRSAEVIIDVRSDFKPYALKKRLLQDFDLQFEGPGPQGEWVGIFRRKQGTA